MRPCLTAVLLLARSSLAAPPPPSPSEQRIQREARRLLGELVAVETVAANETRALGPIAEHLRKSGIPAQILESAAGRGNLVARVKGSGGKRPLLLLAHVDVVPAAGQPWTVAPFQLTEKDGYLYGRGVNDDKGMAAAIVAIAVEARKKSPPLSRDLIVALTAGEETSGAAGVRWLVERHPELLDAELGLNEGGGGGITVSDDLSHIDEVDYGLGAKVYQSYRITARGVGGHSSVPSAGRNPIYALAPALERLGADRFPARVIAAVRPGMASFARTQKPPLSDALRRSSESGAVSESDDAILSADNLSNAFIRTTCAATMLDASRQENVLPVTAEAIVNCRLLPGDTAESVRQRLQQVVGNAALEVTLKDDHGAGVPMEASGEVPDAVRKVSRAFWGEVPVVAGFGFGEDDGRFLTPRGVKVYGVHPNPTSPADGRAGFDAHGPDERVSARWYAEGVRWLNALVLELAR